MARKPKRKRRDNIADLTRRTRALLDRVLGLNEVLTLQERVEDLEHKIKTLEHKIKTEEQQARRDLAERVARMERAWPAWAKQGSTPLPVYKHGQERAE